MKNKHLLPICAALLSVPLVLFLQLAFAKDTEKVAYLTFDDGPTLNTPEIIDILDRYNAKATFFVLEERISMYPDFTRRIVSGKHAIGLHGISHSQSIYSTETAPLYEMEKTNATLENITGIRSKLVRVPFGSGYRLTAAQSRHLRKKGYIIWDWNVDPRDSVGKIIPEKILGNMKKDLSKCTATPVILFHDRKSTAKLLPAVLDYLTKEGYTMLPISEKQPPVCQTG